MINIVVKQHFKCMWFVKRNRGIVPTGHAYMSGTFLLALMLGLEVDCQRNMDDSRELKYFVPISALFCWPWRGYLS